MLFLRRAHTGSMLATTPVTKSVSGTLAGHGRVTCTPTSLTDPRVSQVNASPPTAIDSSELGLDLESNVSILTFVLQRLVGQQTSPTHAKLA